MAEAITFVISLVVIYHLRIENHADAFRLRKMRSA
jgi:hypothetical protein